MPNPLFFETTTVAELMRRGLACHCAGSPGEAINLSAKRATVLVVDDEHIIAETLVLILNSNGYDAKAAYNGESALEMAHASPPDILISDVMMPGMNGLDLAIAVRDFYPKCRILLFSGNAATQDLMKSARAAGYEFELLAKPVHPDTLLQRISASQVIEEAA